MTDTSSTTFVASDKLKGATLYDRADHKLGSVKELYVNPTTGHIAYVLGQAGGVFGVGGKYHPHPWRTLTPRPGDGYILSFTKADLERAPAYDQEQLAGTQYAWSDQVDRYFSTLAGVPLAPLSD
jgi:hypothetical protein